MATPYLGQIELFAFGYAPKGWASCAGQLLPINQYQALFALLGTTYGGNGVNTFALPDLRSTMPIGQGNGPGFPSYNSGQTTGEEGHTLTPGEMPLHNHLVNVVSNPDIANNAYTPDNTMILAQTSGTDLASNTVPYNIYGSPPLEQALSPAAITPSGGSQAHSNLMPYLAVNFCIALTGLFPARN
jgi:microcystin-dependent protein